MKNYFIPFIIGNYPNSSVFIKILNKFLRKGIKTIEIGIPCTDSCSDGEIISKAYTKIVNNFSINSLFKITNKYNKIKKILVCYSNTIENLNIKSIIRKIKNKNYSLLIVDQPLEYLLKIKKIFLVNNVKIVYITSINKKIKKIKKVIKKFKKYNICSHVYLTNRLGVTGNSYNINYKKIHKKYKTISKLTNIPIIMGFGINKKNLFFFKKNKMNFVIGTELVKYINNKKKFNKLIKKCIK